MSQEFIDNVYDSTFVVGTTMANVEKNFTALKSTFSGLIAPSNPVAGMWWYDTTANILKLRNEANNAWQSVWDFANNKPVIANLVSADFAAVLKDPAAGTAGLRTLGTGAQQALPGNARFPGGVQTFISNGTWTKPVEVNNVFVKIWGASGGGGGGGTSSGGGGGGGGYTEGLIAVTAGVSVVIGGGGAGGAAGANGESGGDTQFPGTTTIQSVGGGGGVANGGGGGSGGVASGGDINVNGGDGSKYGDGGSGADGIAHAANGGTGGGTNTAGSSGGGGKLIVYY